MENENTNVSQPVAPSRAYEEFPAWLREEIEQGSTLELRAKLRKALAKAVRESNGLLRQEGWNPEQKYSYTGHAEVMEACRRAMADNGLSIDQPLLEHEQTIMLVRADGREVPRWVWRVVCLVTHEDGGVLARVVRPITMANDKASFVARTAADRVCMMNVMRIAGSKEDPEAENEANEPVRQRQAPQQEEPRRAPQTPQTQARPANAQGQTAPKASTAPSSGAASSAASSRPQTSSKPAADSSKSAPSQASTHSGESPKAQGAPPSTPPASSPSSQSSSTQTAPEGTPLTQEQRASIYKLLGELGIVGPRQPAHLTAVMGRLGLTGRVVQENYQLVVDALAAEQAGG